MTYPSDLWTAQKAPKKRKVGRPKGRIRPHTVQFCLSPDELALFELQLQPGETVSAACRRILLGA